MKKKIIIAIIVIISAVLLFNPFSLWLISALFEELTYSIAEFISEKYDGKIH